MIVSDIDMKSELMTNKSLNLCSVWYTDVATDI